MKIKYLLTVLTLLLVFSTVNAQVTIIANNSVSVSSINKSELLDIYSLSIKNWDNDDKIIVLDLKSDNDVKAKFYNHLGKSNSALKKVWMRAQLTGEGFAPDAMNSEEEILKKVAATPGAIGYVRKSIVNSSVKVLAEIN